MKYRRKNDSGLSQSARVRMLRFDILEERRLFAGLDGTLKVLVFDDPSSARSPGANTSPAVERVVFVDLNRDGSFQSVEPWGITDDRGVATFEGLSPGNYSVRLLGHRSVVETTSSQPATSGDWTLGFGVNSAVAWESETVGWFAGPRSLKKLDLSHGELLREIDLGGEIVSVKVSDSSRSSRLVALIEQAGRSHLVSVDRETSIVQRIPLDGVQSFSLAGDELLAFASNGSGISLYAISMDQIPSDSSGGNSLVAGKVLPAVKEVSDPRSTVHAIGSHDMVLVESIDGGTRVSSWRKEADAWELVAERTFDGQAHFSSMLSNANQFVVETSNGLAVLNNTTGLPVLEVLEESTGPVAFDASRGILFTQPKNGTAQNGTAQNGTGRVQGWSSLDWKYLFEITVAGTNGRETTVGPMAISLGYLKDSLIAVVDGNVYRHSLTSAQGATVSISDGALTQVAIGLRTRGENRAPTLGELPDFTSDEDQALTIPLEWLGARSADEDGDALFYFVRTPGQKGSFKVSSTEFAMFVPARNSNGLDSWSVQAFDGRSWSELRSFQIDIRPVNDAPSEIAGANAFRVPELSSGVVLGRLEVKDPDADAAYRFTVSDSRFVVSNGVLSLDPDASLDFETEATIAVTVTASEINQGDVISEQITVSVEDRNDPPVGISFHGRGGIPENRAPCLVGTVGVIDPDRLEVYDISVSDSRFEIMGNTVRVKPGSGIAYRAPGWIELTFVAVSRTTGDTVRRTERFQIVKDPTPYHNEENPMDVDGDGVVSPLDPLHVINYINNQGIGAVPGEGEGGGQIDVDGDGQVTPIDILIIINELNSQNSQSRSREDEGDPNGAAQSGANALAGGEGEGASQSAVTSAGLNEDELAWRRLRRSVR
jgi:VCBS repeat-containing protein